MSERPSILVACVLVAQAIVAPRLGAERLAVHTYTVADGLAGDQVSVIVQDRQGFLWIGTRTGLSRFDGVGFRSFGTGDGLPHAGVYAILEGSDGTLWFGTGSGLIRLRAERDNTGSAFETVAGIPHGVGALAEDTLGSIWVTSRGRLYRGSPKDSLEFAEVDAGIGQPPGANRSIGSLVADPDGGLWLGSRFGLFRRLADGTIVRYQSADENQDLRNNSLYLDSTGRLWVGGDGVVVFKPATASSLLDLDVKGIRRLKIEDEAPLPAAPGRAVHREIQHPLGAGRVFGLDQGPDGAVWAASHWGAGIIRDASTATHGRYTGLISDHLSSVLVDDVGNVWVGTQSHGLMRINSSGFTSYTEAEGLVDRQTSSVTTGPNGEIVVVSLPPEGTIHLRDGDRFLPLEILLPGDVSRHGWGLNYVSFFDHKGQLWVPTPRGLFRFPHLDDLRDLPRTRHERRYLPEEEIYRLWEDSRGDLWLGVFGEIQLMRWERSTDTIHHYFTDDGISHHTGTAFAEDHSGSVWIGFYGGGLARWRDGSFDSFDEVDGLPRGLVNSILIDHRGRLWVGAHSGGLAMTEDPTAEAPVWTRTTSADGLTSDGVFSLAEDRFGRIFAGSLKGVDRLDPQTGRIDHFDTSTGLVNNLVLDALTGPEGDLWFATDGGVSRYRPVAEPPRSAPAVFIDRLTFDGSDLTVPLRGVVAVPSISLPSHTEVVDIGFAAVDLTPGSRLEFEFTVDSLTEIWSSTNGNRFVRLAGLAPGRRSIAIRARLPDGSVGPAATIDLEIATPLWRRWWFLASLVAAIAISGWIVQRLRIRRLKELHQVRSRIAADLHDEMGLSLARVAILADVAGRSNGDTTTADTLREISGTARDLVDATSDMAWALDPRHDTLAALIARLRRTANDVVEGFDARFKLEADPLDGVPMGSESRRHLFLVLKEAIRNACRHGRPDNVTLRVERRAPGLVITLSDDGVGFDPETPRAGQGLTSMERRAGEMDGTVSIDSAPGRGTRIRLEVPLSSSA